MLEWKKTMFYRILIVLLLVCARPASAQEHLRYFGYFANNTYQSENQAHTNITHVWTGPDRTQARTIILAELQQAKSYGIKAVVSVDSFVFAASGGCPYANSPSAAADFRVLVDDLVTAGYLVPNDPEASTVVAFYPIDEPELCGLKDQGGAPHPALANAVNAIRGDARTSNFPVASIGSKKYDEAIQGLRLFDWVGLDNYGTDNDGYLYDLLMLSFNLRPQQRIIVVPQAAQGGMLDNSYHDPGRMAAYANSEARVIMLMPFLWGHADTNGTRGIPALRDQYREIGSRVKFGLAAQFVGQSVPATMTAGQLYPVSITVKNTGSGTWIAGSHVRLGSQSPIDNSTWGTHRIALPATVAPQQSVTFQFNALAPSAPGNYAFQWRMVADTQAWFGDATALTTVNVTPGPSGSIGVSPSPCIIYAGQSACTVNIGWNSNRADAEVWVADTQNTNPVLFARAQTGTQAAPWITEQTVRFSLRSGATTISSVDVRGVRSDEPPPGGPTNPTCPLCQEP
jgi:hypothetical protein